MRIVTIIKSPFKVVAWGFAMLSRAFRLSVSAVMGSHNFIRWVRDRNKKSPSTHGDAAFATEELLREKGYMAPKPKMFRKPKPFIHGMLACVTEKGERIYTRHERSVLMMAQPGAGKSQHYIADLKVSSESEKDAAPFLMVGDAGNELFNAVGPLLKKAEYQIAKIDLVNPYNSTKYDFLAELDTAPDKRHLFRNKLRMIVESMMPEEPQSKHPHFLQFTRLMLSAAITVDVLYENNQRTIVEIIEMLIDDDARDAMLKRAKMYPDKMLLATLKTIDKMQGKDEGNSMMSTSLRKLEAWTDEAVREVSTYRRNPDGTYYRGWNFTKMLTGAEPVVLFIRSGYQDVGGHFSRIVYDCAVDAVSGIWDDTNRPLSRKLFIYIDEAGLTGYCASIIKAFSRLRKAGAHLRMCFVSMSELKSTYPYPHWETLLGGCDLIVSGGGNDLGLYNYASELAGEYTVQNRSVTESKHGDSSGKSEQARRLIKNDEARGIEENQILVYLDSYVTLNYKPWRRKPEGGVEHL